MATVYSSASPVILEFCRALHFQIQGSGSQWLIARRVHSLTAYYAFGMQIQVTEQTVAQALRDMQRSFALFFTTLSHLLLEDASNHSI
jgi:hypothetical protein